MPRRKLPPQSSFPVFIGARFINRQWFDVPLNVAWEVLGNQFYLMHHGFGVKIHAVVLMSNHFHALVSTPRANLPQAMNYFMGETSRELGRRNGRINQIWGEPYYASVIVGSTAFQNTYKYLYRNPVKAGVTRRCEDYKYSTLRGLLGLELLVIPVTEDPLLFNGHIQWHTIDWLNRAKEDDEAIIKKALRRQKFQYPKRNGYPVRTEEFVY